MPVESFQYIDDLVSSNPVPSEGLVDGDDHIRGIKATIKASFPAFTGPLESSNEEVDAAVEAIENGTIAFADGTEALPGIAFADDLDTGFHRPDDDELSGSVGGDEFLHVTSDLKASFKGDVEAVGAFSGGTGQLVPTGAIFAFAKDANPTGYLECDGTAVSRSTYATLFSLIGTTFGAGDSSTTFNLPDLRGRTIVGKGGAAASRLTATYFGTNPDTFAAVGGSQSHTLTAAQTPVLTGSTGAAGSHSHTYTMHSVAGGGSGWYSPSSGFLSGSTQNTSTASDHTHTVTVNSGGGGAHANVQPSMVLKWVIKT